MSQTKNNGLITVETLNPMKLFTDKSSLNSIFEDIKTKASKLEPDIKTKKGRQNIASMANRVARSKTLLDGMGKELVAETKAKIKKIDIERKWLRDQLDQLKKDVRKPLTDWENAEKKRVDDIKERINWFETIGTVDGFEDSTELKKRLNEVKLLSIDKSFAEFTNEAALAREKALNALDEAYSQTLTYEKEQAELEKLRREKTERERIEREKEVARVAAEKAKLEADRKRQAEIAKLEAEKKAEIEKIEREKIEAEKKRQAEIARLEAEKKAAIEKIEREKLEAERRRQAEIEKLKAEKAEQERLTHEKLEADRKRQADLNHRRKVNNSILESLKGCGASEDLAKKIIKKIFKNQIEYLSIEY